MDPRQPQPGTILEVQERRMEDRTRSRGPTALLPLYADGVPGQILVPGMDHTLGRLSGPTKKFISEVGSNQGLHEPGEDQHTGWMAPVKCQVDESPGGDA